MHHTYEGDVDSNPADQEDSDIGQTVLGDTDNKVDCAGQCKDSDDTWRK